MYGLNGADIELVFNCIKHSELTNLSNLIYSGIRIYQLFFKKVFAHNISIIFIIIAM